MSCWQPRDDWLKWWRWAQQTRRMIGKPISLGSRLIRPRMSIGHQGARWMALFLCADNHHPACVWWFEIYVNPGLHNLVVGIWPRNCCGRGNRSVLAPLLCFWSLTLEFKQSSTENTTRMHSMNSNGDNISAFIIEKHCLDEVLKPHLKAVAKGIHKFLQLWATKRAETLNVRLAHRRPCWSRPRGMPWALGSIYGWGCAMPNEWCFVGRASCGTNIIGSFSRGGRPALVTRTTSSGRCCLLLQDVALLHGSVCTICVIINEFHLREMVSKVTRRWEELWPCN